MIAKRNNKPVNRIFGGGVLDYMTSIHTYDLPEFHSRSYLFGQKYNFNGPKTKLHDRMEDIENRIPKPSSKPINTIDEHAMHHDIDYGQIKKSYDKTKKTKEDRKKHLEQIWDADERFIQGVKSASAHKADPIVSRISEYAIKAKRGLEKAGILPTEYISGFGVKQPKEPRKDPAKRLRALIKQQNKTHNKGPKHNSEKHYQPKNTNYIIKKLLDNKIITI